MNWLPTYSAITINRLLDHYNLQLSQDELINAIFNTETIYYQLLRLPINTISNDILARQTKNYQTHIQKLFADYLLSGKADNVEEVGMQMREQVENERQALLQLNEDLYVHENMQIKLIADMQSSLIKKAHEWQDSLQHVSQKIKKVLNENSLVVGTAEIGQALKILHINYFNKDNLAKNDELWPRVESILQCSLNQDMKNIMLDNLVTLKPSTLGLEVIITTFLAQIQALKEMNNQLQEKFYDLIKIVTELLKTL